MAGERSPSGIVGDHTEVGAGEVDASTDASRESKSRPKLLKSLRGYSDVRAHMLFSRSADRAGSILFVYKIYRTEIACFLHVARKAR